MWNPVTKPESKMSKNEIDDAVFSIDSFHDQKSTSLSQNTQSQNIHSEANRELLHARPVGTQYEWILSSETDGSGQSTSGEGSTTE